MLVLSGMKDEDDGRAIFPHSLSLAIVALCLSCLQPSKRRGERERERERERGRRQEKVFHFASPRSSSSSSFYQGSIVVYRSADGFRGFGGTFYSRNYEKMTARFQAFRE